MLLSFQGPSGCVMSRSKHLLPMGVPLELSFLWYSEHSNRPCLKWWLFPSLGSWVSEGLQGSENPDSPIWNEKQTFAGLSH